MCVRVFVVITGLCTLADVRWEGSHVLVTPEHANEVA